MRKSSTSLADYLTRPNPSIHSVHGDRPTPGTTTKNFRWNFPDDIRPWEDFDLKTFDRFYARPLQHVLDSQYDFNDPPKIQEFPFCEIRDEDSLEALLIVSIHSTVSEALTVTQGDLKAQASGDVIYVSPFKFSDPPILAFTQLLFSETFRTRARALVLSSH